MLASMVLRGQVGGHAVDAVGQILPGAGDALDFRLAAEFAFGADLAGDARDFGGEAGKLFHHDVDGFLELQDFAFRFGGDFTA
jgi:hypothetical protein